MIALLIFAAPLAMYAQVEAVAGSLKLGVHLDTAYRWSGESKKNPQFFLDHQDIHWPGYDTVNIGDVALELTGKVGDRISFKILEALVQDSNSVLSPGGMPGAGMTLGINPEPVFGAATLEAYIDIKIIDQLKFRVGKQLTPTLLANTGLHQSNVFHTANAPLIANRTIGFNEILVDGALPIPTKFDAPDFVTGAAVIASFSGVELSYTWFDGWLLPAADGVGDLGYDFNKTKGGNVALGYTGEVGPGKLAARAFYFDELSEVTPSTPKIQISGWGLGASYTHTNFFVAAEYTNDTLSIDKNIIPAPGKNDNNWYGYYIALGAKFSGIEPVYRFDFVDYTDWNNNAVANLTSFDTEMWHTIGVNYWFNDNAMIGLDYVIKAPEVRKYADYPTINELVIYLEVNTL